ncbi:hypothetical protein NTE_02250 [Candidatus Nitrososphaera evergladensis SR1]|uniref:Uncharacterized protein n=1 Tax=Candidatus Nitrososphaera evergladensis SR1 TaxID=1459636 RepID=A0A075MYF9_9ARCH|nr:hypothetical protein NTE_02250 [Candidatus Nitrososphaera evergladensis SR1]
MVDRIEERIVDHLRRNARRISYKCNPIIKLTAEATQRMFKTAPCNINKLLVEIALRQKGIR